MMDGKQMDLQICNGMAFAEADVVLHSPNLEEQGIGEPHLHPILTYTSHHNHLEYPRLAQERLL